MKCNLMICNLKDFVTSCSVTPCHMTQCNVIQWNVTVMSASSSGTRLHRGCVEEAAPEDTPPETTHIVFVVHGIGQKMDQGRIIRNTSMYVY